MVATQDEPAPSSGGQQTSPGSSGGESLQMGKRPAGRPELNLRESVYPEDYRLKSAAPPVEAETILRRLQSSRPLTNLNQACKPYFSVLAPGCASRQSGSHLHFEDGPGLWS